MLVHLSNSWQFRHGAIPVTSSTWVNWENQVFRPKNVLLWPYNSFCHFIPLLTSLLRHIQLKIKTPPLSALIEVSRCERISEKEKWHPKMTEKELLNLLSTCKITVSNCILLDWLIKHFWASTVCEVLWQVLWTGLHRAMMQGVQRHQESVVLTVRHLLYSLPNSRSN